MSTKILGEIKKQPHTRANAIWQLHKIISQHFPVDEFPLALRDVIVSQLYLKVELATEYPVQITEEDFSKEILSIIKQLKRLHLVKHHQGNP